MMKFSSIPVMISLIFSPLASVMAFLITYSEYLHHYPDKRKPVKLATEAALVTFFVFTVLSLLVGLLLNNIVSP